MINLNMNWCLYFYILAVTFSGYEQSDGSLELSGQPIPAIR